MTRIVGLTGGIGSGKTTVAKMFEALGVSVYIADLQARKINNQPATLKLIVQEFGNAVVENEQLNRTVMAEIVFNNPEKLNQEIAENPQKVFNDIFEIRKKFFNDIVTSSIVNYEKKLGRKATEKEIMKNTQKRFLNGWLNRLNDFKFKE